jgi:hypothetical protein
MTAFEIKEAEFTRVLPYMRIIEFIQNPISLGKLNTLVLTRVMNGNKKNIEKRVRF